MIILLYHSPRVKGFLISSKLLCQKKPPETLVDLQFLSIRSAEQDLCVKHEEGLYPFPLPCQGKSWIPTLKVRGSSRYLQIPLKITLSHPGFQGLAGQIQVQGRDGNISRQQSPIIGPGLLHPNRCLTANPEIGSAPRVQPSPPASSR